MPVTTSIYRRSGAGRRCVLLVHGSLDAGEEWNDAIASMEDADAEFISVDLAGMGKRAGDPGPYTLDRFAADVSAVIAESNKPVVMVGQSMGTQVAELCAAAQPTKVVGLVLVAPVPLGGTGMSAAELAPFQALAGHPDAQRALRRQLGPHLNGAELERLVEIGDLVRPEVGATLAETWNRGHKDGAKPSTYLGPTLVVRGGEDPFVTRELVSKSVLPRFQHVSETVVSLAGHWPHVEQPAALARILNGFLNSLDRTATSATPRQLNTAGSVKQQAWTEAFDYKSGDAFAKAFAPDVVLEASVLLEPIAGREQVKVCLAAAGAIYESVLLTQEASNGVRSYLEWEARGLGVQFLGLTILTKNERGEIAHIAIHHRPLVAALTFSTELGQRLRGAIDARHFSPAH
jgi:pimeloyl-ACP methyl ester carboxylesterase